MPTSAPLEPIEIFRPGTHTSMSGHALTFSEADLTACAAAYDVTVWKAPLCVGHPKHDDPRYGDIKAVKFASDGKGGGILTAEVDRVEPDFADLVRAGRYTSVSAAFWGPTDPANPKPGKWSLRHVGFLGAVPPALKGLKPVQFAETDDGGIAFAEAPSSDAGFWQRMCSFMFAELGRQPTPPVLPPAHASQGGHSRHAHR